MSKKMVVMDIGSTTISIIEGRINNGLVEINKGAVVAIPPNCIAEGRIEDEVPLKYALKSALSEHKIRGKNVILTVQGSYIIDRELILPSVAPGEIRNMVQYEMEQSLPSSIDMFVIEYRIMQEFEDDGVNKFKIRAAAMPKDMAQEYYVFLKSLRLKPIALDIHSNSISKLFKNEFTVNEEDYTVDKTAAIVDAGARSTTVHIINGGVHEFSRIIPLGGKDMDMSVAKVLDIPIDKAETRKREELNLDMKTLDEENSTEILKATGNYLNRWTSEIQKVLQYYLSRKNHITISNVFVYGGGSKIKGLSVHMEKVLGIHTEKIERTSRIKFNKDTGSLNSECYINAAGSMIRD